MSTEEHPARLRRLMFRWTIFRRLTISPEMTADVPWRDDPPDGGYYSYSEYGESGIDECRQPDSVRAKNQKENSAEKQKNGGHSKKNLAVEYLANGTVSIKSAVRSKKTGEISVDVRVCAPAAACRNGGAGKKHTGGASISNGQMQL